MSSKFHICGKAKNTLPELSVRVHYILISVYTLGGAVKPSLYIFGGIDERFCRVRSGTKQLA